MPTGRGAVYSQTTSGDPTRTRGLYSSAGSFNEHDYRGPQGEDGG
jgi:hypothetical protein